MIGTGLFSPSTCAIFAVSFPFYSPPPWLNLCCSNLLSKPYKYICREAVKISCYLWIVIDLFYLGLFLTTCLAEHLPQTKMSTTLFLAISIFVFIRHLPHCYILSLHIIHLMSLGIITIFTLHFNIWRLNAEYPNWMSIRLRTEDYYIVPSMLAYSTLVLYRSLVLFGIPIVKRIR